VIDYTEFENAGWTWLWQLNTKFRSIPRAFLHAGIVRNYMQELCEKFVCLFWNTGNESQSSRFDARDVLKLLQSWTCMSACTHQLQSIVYFQIIVVTGVTGFQLKKWKTELYNLRKQRVKNSVSCSLEARTCRWKSSWFLQVETSTNVDYVSVNNKRNINNYV